MSLIVSGGLLGRGTSPTLVGGDVHLRFTVAHVTLTVPDSLT